MVLWGLSCYVVWPVVLRLRAVVLHTLVQFPVKVKVWMSHPWNQCGTLVEPTFVCAKRCRIWVVYTEMHWIMNSKHSYCYNYYYNYDYDNWVNIVRIKNKVKCFENGMDLLNCFHGTSVFWPVAEYWSNYISSRCSSTCYSTLADLILQLQISVLPVAKG